MLGSVCSVLILPVFITAFQDELPPNWIVYAPKSGEFSIAMPDKPLEKKHEVNTTRGQLQVNMLVAAGRNNSLFVVSYSDLPASDLKKGAVERRLDQARDSAVSSARGKLRSEKAVELEGHPGREIVIEKDGIVSVQMRIFLVGHRLYQTMVLGNGSLISAADVRVFLDSLRLKK